MNLLKETSKRIILIIILISILITFLATPASFAKLELEDGEYYYSGTTKGSYVPSSSNIFGWLINALGQIADFILGMLSMIIRAPFVGWTALLEKMLTWALESTMGVSADGSMVGTTAENGEFSVNTSNLTGLTDSSNNVTVEAIVYNRVAALDIDLFDVNFDRTTSGTGQKLVCRQCEKQNVVAGTGVSPYISKPVNECITDDKIETIKTKAASLGKNEKLNTEDFCADNCDCNGCDACEFYIAQLLEEEPIIYKLKSLVATWYTILRLLSIAAMLLVLLGVGLKMAISTIASDKAVYKRMLVDWVVGFIIVFTIHYFMIFIIQINEILVNTIADTASERTKFQMVELGEDAAEYTDSDLELKIYEEVRTRAYDAKLSNGMIGMVMYMTLVFLAFKYVVIYLKRFLTIVVLTLMAPAVGVAYALQKVLSGKSAAFKTWMTEYIMNVIIQTVHALIYSIFVSQALIMSLQSIAGMILALILMNYLSKADELFKKIFKFGGGDSLLGHTEGAADSLKQNMDAMMGFAAGAKPVAKALMSTPHGKLITGMGKAAVAGFIATAGAGYNFIQNRARNMKPDSYYREKEIDAEMNANYGGSDYKTFANGDKESKEEYGKRRAQAAAVVDARYDRKKVDKFYGEKLEEETEEENGLELKTKAKVTAAKLKAEGDRPQQQTKEEAKNAKRAHNKFKSAQIPSTRSIIRAHWERLISQEDVFAEGRPTGSNAFTRAFKAAWVSAVGSSHYDRKKGRWVNDGNSLYDQLSADKLLGLTDQDKNMLKDIGGDMVHGLIGMGSLFVGMGTIVSSPKAGMALLGKGIASTSKVFGRDTDISRCPATYKFGRFSAETIDKMRKIALEKAQSEGNEALVAELKRRYPNLVESMKNGLTTGVTVASLTTTGGLLFTTGGAIAAASALPVTAAVGAATVVGTRLTRNSAISGKVDKLVRHHAKQQKKLVDEFNKEADNEELNAIKASTSYRDKCFEKMFEQQALDEIGYKKEEGEEDRVKIKAPEIREQELRDPSSFTEKGVAPKVVAETLDKELDRIITSLTTKGTIDITSKSVQDNILKQLGESLESKKIIEEAKEVEQLLIGGKSELTRKLKLKALVRNKAVEEAERKLKETLTNEEVTEVQNIIKTIATAPKGKNVSEITVEDVVTKMKTKSKDGSQQVEPKDGSKQEKQQGTVEIDDKKQQAIQEYLKMIQQPVAGEGITVQKEAADVIVNEAKAQATIKKQNTKKKLKEVLAAAIDPEKIDPNTGTISKEKVNELLLNDGINPEMASAYTMDTLNNLFKIKELNQKVLKREPEIPRGSSKEYAMAVRDNSVEIIRITEDRKKLLSLEMEQQSGTSKKSAADIASEMERLKLSIKNRESRINETNSKLQFTGPIQNVNDYINGTIFKEKK